MITNFSQSQKLSYPVSYKKKNGRLILNSREKQLEWIGSEDSTNRIIKFNDIIEIKKATKEKTNTELLYLKVLGSNEGVVFSFDGDRKLEFRDRFFDLLTRKDEYDKVFYSLPVFEKKKILQVLYDVQLNYLFEELVLNYKILSKEDYFAYLKKRYSPKITFLNSQQVIQLSRTEEIRLFSNPYKNVFDHITKRKLLLSSDYLNTLYEVDIKGRKSEQNFWREFLNNQKKNKTEIVGGIKSLYFSNEEEKIILEEKEKAKALANPSNVSASTTTLFSVAKKPKIPKRFENLELHKNYSHKHFGPYMNVAEYDYKDKEMKKISEVSDEEEYNKKEIANFIENINNYSMRKIENINYINPHNFVQKFLKNKLITKSEIEAELGENKTKIESKKISTMNRLNEMKLKRAASNFKKESVDTFRKINDLINTNAIAIWEPKITDQEKAAIESLKYKINLIRDLQYIYNTQIIRNTYYSDDVKKFKRNNIKNLSQDVMKKIAEFEKDEILTPVVKANLEIIKSSLAKIK